MAFTKKNTQRAHESFWITSSLALLDTAGWIGAACLGIYCCASLDESGSPVLEFT